MSEVGLVCRQRLPTMAEMVGLDKSKAITSKQKIEIQFFKQLVINMTNNFQN